MGLPTAKEIIDRYDTSKKSSLYARASASKTMIKASNAEKGKLENIQDMIYYLETLIGAIIIGLLSFNINNFKNKKRNIIPIFLIIIYLIYYSILS